MTTTHWSRPLNTSPGTVTSLGFGGYTAPTPQFGATVGTGNVAEEEEVSNLIQRVVEDVSVESRQEQLDADDDELLEAKLRRLQGRK